jgi:hypothetical protein
MATPDESSRHDYFGPTEEVVPESQTRSYQREDDRWEGASPLRDWLILLAIGALHFTWMFLIFLFEPGIR